MKAIILVILLLSIPLISIASQQINNRGEKIVESINVKYYSEGKIHKPYSYKFDFKYNQKNEIIQVTKSYEYNASPYQDGFELKKGLEIYNIKRKENGLINTVDYIAFSNGKQLPIKKEYTFDYDGKLLEMQNVSIGECKTEYKFDYEGTILRKYKERCSFIKETYLNYYYIVELEWNSNLSKYVCTMNPEKKEDEVVCRQTNQFIYSQYIQDTNININNLLVIGELHDIEELTFGFLGRKSSHFILNSETYKRSPFSHLDNEFELDKDGNIYKIIQKKKDGSVVTFQVLEIVYKN